MIRRRTTSDTRQNVYPVDIARFSIAAILCLLISVCPSYGQRRQGNRAVPVRGLPVLARSVSDKATIFIEIDNLGLMDVRLQDAGIWTILQDMVGEEEDGGWSKLLSDTFGDDSTAKLKRLFGRRVGFAAMDWEHLAHGVVLCTISAPNELDWIAKQADSTRRIGKVSLHKMKSGVWLASDGETLLISQRLGGGALLGESIKLLDGKSRNSLMQLKDFRTHVGILPSPRNGCMYWSSRRQRAYPDERIVKSTSMLPDVAKGALGIYAREDRVEVVLMGTADTNAAFRYQPRIVFDRVVSLPQTTLGAWVTSVDVANAYDSFRESPPLPLLDKFLGLIGDQVDAERFREEVISNLGSRCVAILGCDIESSRLNPQLGLLVESVDSAGVVNALQGTVSRVLESLSSEEEDGPARLESFEHLGKTVFSLQFVDAPRPVAGSFASLITENMAVSFVDMDGWVAISTSSSHIKSIISAANGMAPTLGETLPPGRMAKQLRRSVTAGVFQPSFTSEMYRFWKRFLDIKAQKNDVPDSPEEEGGRLGISISTEDTAGQVVVIDVSSNGPSNGLLAAGDSIIAFDGRMLNMEASAEHLATLVERYSEEEPVTLRVLRNGGFEEVAVLPRRMAPKPVQEGLEATDPVASAFRPLNLLQSAADEVAVMVYTISRPSHQAYQAQLVLQFTTQGLRR